MENLILTFIFGVIIGVIIYIGYDSTKDVKN